MRFAKFVFLISGIYGLLVVTPQYFLETRTGIDYPPPVTHPEFYYGFVGIVVVFQIVFLIISSNPIRYRNMMIPSILEKLAFFIPAVILYSQHRIPPVMLGFATFDLFWGALFVISFFKTPAAQDMTKF